MALWKFYEGTSKLGFFTTMDQVLYEQRSTKFGMPILPKMRKMSHDTVKNGGKCDVVLVS